VRAAQYVGISVGTFDKLVTDGRMPPPKRIDSRKVWESWRWTWHLMPCPKTAS
jgi:predicted DNA-binding transcriptional regulator AlpA